MSVRRLNPVMLARSRATIATSPARPLFRASTAEKRKGKVTRWHPFDRRGVIVEEDTGREYTVASTAAFETVLPTMLRSLEGALVEFEIDTKPDAARVITRKHHVPITARSYEMKPPVDFLAPFMNTTSQGDQVAGMSATLAGVELFAKNVVVDMKSIPADQLVRCSGPLIEEEVVRPTHNVKDMRTSRLFDAETNELIALRRSGKSPEEAQDIVQQRREMREAQMPRVVRQVEADGMQGLVLAWSSIHRSGVIAEGLTTMPEDALFNAENIAGGVCIIRNVHCFKSAMPSSNNLLHRRVTFDKVTYSTQPNKSFAENIVVEGVIEFDASAATPEEVRESMRREQVMERRKKQLGTHFLDDGMDAHSSDQHAEAPLPQGPIYGVITRWSSGQGTVESGDGRLYYVQSAAAFRQLVDQSSHAIRGAVVTFHVRPEQRRYACDIDILSSATTSVQEMQPLLGRVPGSSRNTQGHVSSRDEDEEFAVNEITKAKVPLRVDAEPEGVTWFTGTLLSWSPAEGQGIIHGDDGTRYVLRDAEDHVIQFAQRKQQMTNGRKLKFTPFGATGRLACNVVPLDAEATEEEMSREDLRAADTQFSLDGNVNEAVASPMSTSYWLGRMDKAGYDTTEVKKLQNRALTLDEDDGDDGTEDGKFLDSEDLFKKDPWWNDPRKNMRFPNSDITAGHLALMGPASMMNMAMKTKDPKKLEKMSQKYQARLTEGQKEYAWKQAREMAPRYESLIKKARERNEEPSFYFF